MNGTDNANPPNVTSLSLPHQAPADYGMSQGTGSSNDPCYFSSPPQNNSIRNEDDMSSLSPPHLPMTRNGSTREVRCRTCGGSFPSFRELFHHQRKQHHSRGYGLPLQPSPFAEGEEQWNENPQLRQVYERYRHVILGHHQEEGMRQIFNFPLPATPPTPEALQDQLRQIHSRLQNSYRVNLSAGIILQHRVTGQYRYYHAWYNSTLLPSPLAISDPPSLDEAIQRIASIRLDEFGLQERPDTQWIPVLITNITWFVYPAGYPLAGGWGMVMRDIAWKCVNRNWQLNTCL